MCHRGENGQMLNKKELSNKLSHRAERELKGGRYKVIEVGGGYGIGGDKITEAGSGLWDKGGVITQLRVGFGIGGGEEKQR